ncbi:MAG: RusA family crossover junction endodeoxyribonuclease [Microcoleaceae cyanobacterium]
MMLINLQDLAKEINLKHQQCQNEPINSMADAYFLGQLLLETKTFLSTEKWQNLLQNNCDLSEKIAETYMQIARSWPSFRTVLDNYRKVDLSDMEDIPQMPLTPSESKDSLLLEAEKAETLRSTNLEMGVNKIITKDLETEVDKIIPSQEKTDNLEPFPEKISTYSFPNSEKLKNSEIINFYIPGKVVPKARPRVTANGTYLPPRYRAWRNLAEVEIYRQVSEFNLEANFPIQKAAISISFCGKHRTNSDLDNLAGACLDALTLNGAGVLQDDRLSCIPKLTVEYIPDTKETGVWIKIEILSISAAGIKSQVAR